MIGRLGGLAGDLLALVSGGLLPLAFAPFGFFPVAPLSVAILIASWIGVSPKRALLRGWLYGLGQYGVGASWIYISIERYGNALPFVAPLVTVLFVAVLALYPALVGYLGRKLVPRSPTRMALVVVPALWVLAEWVKGWFLSGFSWLDLGYSQIDGPLGCLAPVIGVYGVSAAVVLTGGVVVALASGTSRVRLSVLALGVALWVGASLLGGVAWVQPKGAPLSVSVVQGNIDQARKWRPEEAQSILATYRKLTETEWGRDLILWPETAVPLFLREAADYVAELAERVEESGSDLVFGVPTRGPRPREYYNSVVSLSEEIGIYRKRHLVPFGEYFPLRGALRWLNFMDVPMADFSPGADDQPPLKVKNLALGATICYEITRPPLVRSTLPEAALLVTVSNDAWFGDSLAPHQHLEIARMRARESGRPLLRATNTGISAIIDARGELVAVSPQFRAAVLAASVQPMQGATPYVRWGETPVLAVALGLVITCLSLEYLRRRRRLYPELDG
ncbi:MAG: apolipoprotein N-acyltransferase [Gammaproteobacteria bacterium]